MPIIIAEQVSLSKAEMRSVFDAKGKSNSKSVVVGGANYAKKRLVLVSFIGTRQDDGLYHGTITFIVDGESASTTKFDFLKMGVGEDDGNYSYSD